MPEWVLWMIAAGVLAVGEIFSLSFFLGPIAIAAVVAAAVAAAGAGVAAQIAVFVAAALVGASALVTERIDADSGQVKLTGELWTARAYDEDEVIEAGQRVRVMQIEGATALVANGLD